MALPCRNNEPLQTWKFSLWEAGKKIPSEMGMWEMTCSLSPMMSALLLYVTQRPYGMLHHSAAGSLPSVVKSARYKKQAGVCLWPVICSDWHSWLLHHSGVIYRTWMFLTQCHILFPEKLHITWVHTENTIAPMRNQLSLASLSLHWHQSFCRGNNDFWDNNGSVEKPDWAEIVWKIQISRDFTFKFLFVFTAIVASWKV